MAQPCPGDRATCAWTACNAVEGPFGLSEPLHQLTADEQVAMPPRHGCGSRGEPHLRIPPHAFGAGRKASPLETPSTLNYLPDMLKLIRTAAIAASLAIVPGAVLSQDPIGPTLALAT